MSDQGISAWKLPLIVAGICVSIVAAFYVGGPGMGMAEGSIVAGIIVVMAVRRRRPAADLPSDRGLPRQRAR